jgi:hypothetical protein
MKKLKTMNITMNIFKNIYALYFIFLVAILHAGWFLYYKQFKSIIIFATSCLVIYLINKNMILVLGLSIIIVDLLYLLNKKEGFEENIDSNDISNNDLNDLLNNVSNNVSNDLSNVDSMDISNNIETFDDIELNKDSMSDYMEDKTIIEKLNPIIVDSIKRMNSTYIEELNKSINALNNLKDP